MTDTIYIVTSGSYSDYKIHAVFLDKNAAAAYLAEHDPLGPYNDVGCIEPWPIGPLVAPQGMKAFLVAMDTHGTIHAAYSDTDLIRLAWLNETEVRANAEDTWFQTHMFARSREHAIKIANERRSILLGLERWTPGDHSEVFR